MKIGFCSLLTVLFIGLRITEQIDWSWFLVLLPMIISIPALFFVELLKN